MFYKGKIKDFSTRAAESLIPWAVNLWIMLVVIWFFVVRILGSETLAISSLRWVKVKSDDTLYSLCLTPIDDGRSSTEPKRIPQRSVPSVRVTRYRVRFGAFR